VRKSAHHSALPGKGVETIHLQRILLCTDFSDYTHRAADYAFSLAREYNADVTLLTVLEHLPSSMDLHVATAGATRRLDELIPSEASNWCRLRSAVRVGRPYQEIIQLALEEQIDMVIVGVRGRNALDLALFGSTTHRVIQLGSCPVLAVHI